jgi:hypothetical protein
MKRLIVLIGFVLIATIALSQQQRMALNNIKCNLGEYEDCSGIQPYMFTYNGWGGSYIISYETIPYQPNTPQYDSALANREVHLFRENPENSNKNKWVKVTTKPLQTDFYRWDSVGYAYFNDGSLKTRYAESFTYYFTAVYEYGEKNGNRVVKLDDDNVAVFLTNLNLRNTNIKNGVGFSMSNNYYETYKIIVIDRNYNATTFNLTFSADSPYSYKEFPRQYHVKLLSQLKTNDVKKDTFTLEVDGESFKFIKQQ